MGKRFQLTKQSNYNPENSGLTSIRRARLFDSL